MPGKDKAGFILTTILGILGAVIGGYIGQALGFYTVGEPAGFIMSVLGALILLFIVGKFRK
ncbi:GlsB/YeaQ/YmgE family stress response membrane protein [Bdellovibrio reynosensis]|uniref:GlsB/YeaQ/YmgE family stress response membrane protein n=1 Tax=Bdellovibrio reynosensis TaxID=2835041 RepID=A0ABY4C628_9BACT|nr:GlsB/YeaQ/YmgE family stress response membrane protein [Bdellovibrio reynosensis]